MIFFDSSALVKLVVSEDETAALTSWVATRTTTPWTSSGLARVEVIRAVRRADATAVASARSLLAGIDLVLVSTEVLELAADLGTHTLRSLDAVHLASAVLVGADLQAFVAYDQRLLDAATAAGLPTVTPS